jgi:hypothetical protein
MRAGLGQYMAADALHIAAVTAAVYFVVRLTAMQRSKAAEQGSGGPLWDGGRHGCPSLRPVGRDEVLVSLPTVPVAFARHGRDHRALVHLLWTAHRQ